MVALHPEGVDRNVKSGQPRLDLFASPSTRRAWIEIYILDYLLKRDESPSTRRAWIEIFRPSPIAH